jgi:hypothetical protein
MWTKANQEVPNEEMKVETIGALENRYGDRNRGVSRPQLLKKRTQGYGGSRKKVTTARRWMTRRAFPDDRKGSIHKETGRDNVARRATNGETFAKRQRKGLGRDNFAKGTPKDGR